MSLQKRCAQGSLIGVLVLVFLSLAQISWAEGIASDPANVKWAFISAAIVMGMTILGAGFAVAYVGAAAVGAISEKPELTFKALLYVALAEGLAILGFTVAFYILLKV